MRGEELKAGDRVNWLYRPSGGYGYAIPVAGIVLSVGKRVAVKVAHKSGETETKHVDRKWLSMRTTNCAELGETQ